MSAGQDTAAILLGTGVVGGALLQQLADPAARRVRLVGVARSQRQQLAPGGLDPARATAQLEEAGSDRDDTALLAALDASELPVRVIIDATASVAVAGRHATWLAAGYHVVTANKLALGGGLDSWHAVKAACTSGGTHYGDAATVGAGLPVLSSLRRLLACGDRLHRLEGVFSGSLSWLFNDFDEHAAFSQRLALARSHGYTEPDPREDLSGGDVARKLLILARAAGFPLQLEQLEVENLVPAGLRDGGVDAFLDQVAALDGPLQARVQAARERGHVLRYLAQLDGDGHARVGLCEVGPAHPAAALHGTDNQFVITTDRYRERPLVIGGPGAGPEVTAQALLGDLLDCTPAATLLRAAA